MSALSVLAPQVDATAAPAATSAAELARRGQIHATAQKFEASFLTTVLQTMFQSVSTAPPFGGGEGEDMWKSFLAESMARSMARRGGVGVAGSVEREMLRLQGLSDAPQNASPAAGSGAGGPASTGSASSSAANGGAANGGAANGGAANGGAAFTRQTYPGLAAAAQKAVEHPRWPAVGAAGKGAAKPGAAQKATVQ
jgi:Rod binding domain-containing protein